MALPKFNLMFDVKAIMDLDLFLRLYFKHVNNSGYFVMNQFSFGLNKRYYL